MKIMSEQVLGKSWILNATPRNSYLWHMYLHTHIPTVHTDWHSHKYTQTHINQINPQDILLFSED